MLRHAAVLQEGRSAGEYFVVLKEMPLRHRSTMKTKAKTSRRAKPARKRRPAIDELIGIMARLRSPTGCPWDREQDHMSLRFHAVEEVYELMDAIEAGDDHEMVEELGDLLLQVVFHCQLAKERRAFDFEKVAQTISEKLLRRHPHVFGESDAKTVDEVWAQWEKIKKAEKAGSKQERPSALDGIPKHLPSLLYAEKLVKKARKAKLLETDSTPVRPTKEQLAQKLFSLAATAQAQGWSAEELLRAELRKRERNLRERESHAS
jgi:MazG family protein